ncbi:hypothetical protein V494_08618, partial [Pseudogymnoascus sp. VKM F-4513 (FW-928)]
RGGGGGGAGPRGQTTATPAADEFPALPAAAAPAAPAEPAEAPVKAADASLDKLPLGGGLSGSNWADEVEKEKGAAK